VREKRQKELFQLLKHAEDIHLELWSLIGGSRQPPGAATADKSEREALMNSVLRLMDMQTLRVQAALVNRIRVVIWLTL
jgi:hypothetical protein